MRNTTLARLSAAAALLALAVPALAQDAADTGPAYGTFGVDLTSQKPDVKPGDDFWTFANGAWDARTEIAADRTSAGPSVKLVDQAELQVKQILADAAADPAATGQGAQQFGDLYAGFMDQAGIRSRPGRTG